MRRPSRQNKAAGVDRITRVNELLKREIADWIESSGISGAGTLVSVTRVDCATTLQAASVYITVFNPEKEAEVMQALNKRKAELQQAVSRRVILKYTPVLRFIADHAIEAGDRVLAKLRELEEQEDNED